MEWTLLSPAGHRVTVQATRLRGEPEHSELALIIHNDQDEEITRVRLIAGPGNGVQILVGDADNRLANLVVRRGPSGEE